MTAELAIESECSFALAARSPKRRASSPLEAEQARSDYTRLLEREEPRSRLEEALKAARAGRGRVVSIEGEAGIGKTSLALSFAEAHRRDARLYVGGCEQLATPEPLGPLRDIARDSQGLSKTDMGRSHDWNWQAGDTLGSLPMTQCFDSTARPHPSTKYLQAIRRSANQRHRWCTTPASTYALLLEPTAGCLKLCGT